MSFFPNIISYSRITLRNSLFKSLRFFYLLMVTLSLSPSIMLFGVRSLWTILFSLCKYRRAKHNLKEEQETHFISPNTHITNGDHYVPLRNGGRTLLYYEGFKSKIYLYKYFPQSFFSEMVLFFLQRTEVFSEWCSFDKFHNYIQPVIYRKSGL